MCPMNTNINVFGQELEVRRKETNLVWENRKVTVELSDLIKHVIC